MSAVVAAPGSQRTSRPLSTGGLVVLAFGTLDFGLETSIVLPALPALAQHYSASLIAVSWLAIGFLVASVVAVPLFGRLGDLFGHRRLLLVAIGAFAGGSLLCAVSDSVGLVIAGRVVQGIGAAVGPLGLGIVRDALPPERLPRGIGVLVGTSGAGAAIGYLLSGVLVDHVSVVSLFWFLFGVAMVLLVATAVVVPASPVRARGSVDVAGAGLIVAGLAGLLVAISKGNDWGWDSGRVLGLFAAAVVLLAAFVLVEGRVREPLLDLAFMFRRPFAGANTCAFAVGYALAVAVIVVPQLAALPTATGYGLGYSTTSIGFLLMPMAVLSVAAAWVAGRFLDAVGPRGVLAAGALAALAAYLILIWEHGGATGIAIGLGALGVALGLAITGILATVVRAAPDAKTSAAASVQAVLRTTGSAVGAAAVAAIITGAGRIGPVPVEAGFTRALVMGAIVSACAVLVSALMPGR
jgi:MFS family permease